MCFKTAVKRLRGNTSIEIQNNNKIVLNCEKTSPRRFKFQVRLGGMLFITVYRANYTKHAYDILCDIVYHMRV